MCREGGQIGSTRPGCDGEGERWGKVAARREWERLCYGRGGEERESNKGESEVQVIWFLSSQHSVSPLRSDRKVSLTLAAPLSKAEST